MEGGSHTASCFVSSRFGFLLAAAFAALAVLFATEDRAGASAYRAGLAIDLDSGPSGSNPGGFIEFDGDLYFAARTAPTGYELWRTDGRFTQLVTDIWPGEESSSPDNFVLLGDRLLFTASIAGTGRELW